MGMRNHRTVQGSSQCNVDVTGIVESLGGVASRQELLSQGISRGALSHAQAVGRIIRIEPGLFRHPEADESAWDYRRRRALAWAGPACVLSFRAAADLWGLTTSAPSGPIEVSIPHGRRLRSLADVKIHQQKYWNPVRVAGWPTTAARQTLVDLASLRPIDELRFPALQAVNDHLVSPQELLDTAGVPRRSLGRWNLVAEEALAGAVSGGEGAYWRLVHESALPDPLLNHDVDTAAGRFRVDAIWPDLNLVTEVDGRFVHAQREAFTRDRIRQNALHAVGLVVIRFTVGQIRWDPREVLNATEEMMVTRAQQLGRQIRWKPLPAPP